MSPLPLFVLGVSAFTGGIWLNGNADQRLATAEDTASKGGAAPDVTAYRAESITGTVLAVAGLVGVIMATVKATE